MTALNEIQQHLFQYLSTVHMVNKNKALKHFKDILSALKSEIAVTEGELDKQIAGLNKFIKAFDLDIEECQDELSSLNCLVLVNTTDWNIAQKAKFYDKCTTQMFSKIVEACITSELGHVSETMCVNLSIILDVTRSAAQASLQKLIHDKWILTKDGNIYLTTRTMLELEQLIKHSFGNNVHHCPLCKRMLSWGADCSLCDTKIHVHCLEKYFDKKQHVCPSCKQAWQPKENPAVSEYVDAQDDTPGPSQPKKSRMK